ncbi:hypothetical protein [Streptomyces albicerus]|uniref:hypothetical protein n=1 Tax=Streptomyces albicerus TaxID=2569859 RepID=UPI00124B6F0B|nr:hypothetical protein [Streptomyces albicerus]
MNFVQLLGVVWVVGFEQLVQWRYGAVGLFGLALLGFGVRARNSACTVVAAVIFVLLMTQA